MLHTHKRNCVFVRLKSAFGNRLIWPGFFNPPGGRPICVSGLHWLGLLVLGQRGAPVVAALQWWTSREERASDKRIQVQQLLDHSVLAWGRQVRHIFDRDFASGAKKYELRCTIFGLP